MNLSLRMNTIFGNQKGVAAILVTIMLIALVGVAALAVDIGYLAVAKNELQNIADSAALAGAGDLSRQYMDVGFTSVDSSAIVAIAENVADSNVSGFIIEVEIGTWINRATGFDATAVAKPNAVRVVARKDNGSNSQVPSFFARVLSFSGFDAQADAVAALTGASEIGPGELEIPVGISQQWFSGEFCNQQIQFYPTSGTTGCAGWHNYFTSPANANRLIDVLDGLADLTFEAPGVDLNDEPSFAFIGGNLSSATDSMYNLYQTRAVDGLWETKVVVYGEDCGENPNQAIPIVGFATVVISGVAGPPPVLTASVECEEVIQEPGGGNYYGTWGAIPGLVE